MFYKLTLVCSIFFASFTPTAAFRLVIPVTFRSTFSSLSAKAKARPEILPDLSQPVFPEPPLEGYDLVVLGSGPGGESAAVHAAKLGARVAVIEKKAAFGGPTGLSSKVLFNKYTNVYIAFRNLTELNLI